MLRPSRRTPSSSTKPPLPLALRPPSGPRSRLCPRRSFRRASCARTCGPMDGRRRMRRRRRQRPMAGCQLLPFTRCRRCHTSSYSSRRSRSTRNYIRRLRCGRSSLSGRQCRRARRLGYQRFLCRSKLRVPCALPEDPSPWASTGPPTTAPSAASLGPAGSQPRVVCWRGRGHCSRRRPRRRLPSIGATLPPLGDGCRRRWVGRFACW
mmetsp:Transcript_88111/g.252547  ORF Transcript_88111/g.252547 Transcript_88111/m.252547 type:complete len:208 (-) Transcript_88111:282-905(-)